MPLVLFYIGGPKLLHHARVGFLDLHQIGVLVLGFIDEEIRAMRARRGAGLTLEDVREGVVAATGRRVRPVVMTAVSTMAGLLPIMLSQGTGSDVTHRIAAPMLGGMFTVLVLNLLVLPVLYSFVVQWRERMMDLHDGMARKAPRASEIAQ